MSLILRGSLVSHRDHSSPLDIPLVSKLDDGCFVARHEHLVDHFRHFCPKATIPVGAYSNIVFIHLLASVVCIKYLFQELIGNTGVSYHVVESVSLNGKRIAMVEDGARDLIYRGVLSRNFSRTD